MNVAFILAEATVVPFLIIVGLLLTIFWLVELLVLMNMTGDEFPWRYDKVLWLVIVFFGLALGALVFLLWQRGRKIEVRLAREAHAMLRGRKQADTQGDE